MLWFDVETRYKTTMNHDRKIAEELWFDAEIQDIRQPFSMSVYLQECCGLM